MSLSYTERKDVLVPSVTICRSSLEARPHDSSAEVATRENVSVARTVWNSNLKLKDLLLSCTPYCEVSSDVGFPGGEVDVSTGSWTTWMHDHLLCHTFTPNMTWRELTIRTQGMPTRDLSMQLSNADEDAVKDTVVMIHPRRRPVFNGLGIESDKRFCISPSVVGKFFVKSYVRDYEALRRAPCFSCPNYFEEECLEQCHEGHWIERYNCSLPQMVKNFPRLVECPPSYLNLSLQMIELRGGCGCRRACLYRMLDTNLLRRRTADEATNVTGLVLATARIPEEVATYRKSYRFASLMSDVGGFTSMMLGFTVVSLADVATKLLQRCYGREDGRSRAPKTQTVTIQVIG